MANINDALSQAWFFDVNENFEGREIKLVRNVDLASYNDYETQAKSIDWIVRNNSEDIEFDIANSRILKLYADRFILQATEYGIMRYEKMLGITPAKEETLVDRRRRVYFLWNKQIFYTHRTLERILEFLLGKGFFEITLFYDDYGIWIDVTVSRDFDLDALYDLLRWKILPANLDIQLRLNFKTELVLVTQLGDYTYEQFLCGLHDTGTIPRIRWEGQATVIDTVHDTAIDDAKNYKPLAGEKHIAPQLYNDRTLETINMTSFKSYDYYSFEK